MGRGSTADCFGPVFCHTTAAMLEHGAKERGDRRILTTLINNRRTHIAGEVDIYKHSIPDTEWM